MAEPQEENPEFWHKLLVEGEKPVRWFRTVMRRLPASPRCKLCLAPFASIGGRMMGLAGFGPSRKNPAFCNS